MIRRSAADLTAGAAQAAVPRPQREGAQTIPAPPAAAGAAPPGPRAALQPAPVWRRLVAMVYETLIVAAVILVAGLIFQWAVVGLGLTGGASTWRLTGALRTVFQLYLATAMGLYFCACWHRGQTLAMRTWRLRLVSRDDAPPGWRAALVRYLAALVLLGPTLAALLWLREHPDSAAAWLLLLPGAAALGYCAANPARSALYDRIAGTRLVVMLSAARPTTSS